VYQEESGIPATTEIYIAADSVRSLLWWSHQYVLLVSLRPRCVT